jgi:putative adhesin/cell wall-active antibiotic response 4TMS protein YvqF
VSNGLRQRNSIFGGLLLILLGVLFLLARFNPDLRMWHLFWRYWPVLIIVWGVTKLIDNVSAHHAGQTRPPLLTGGEAALLILVVLVLAGMGIYSRVREKMPELNINMGLFDHKATQSQELPPKTIPAGSHVTVSTGRGSITVHVGEGNDLRVNVNETAVADSDSGAQERLKSIKVVVDKTGDGYSVHPANSSDNGEETTADLDVSLPAKISLTANTSHGDISISGVSGAVTAATQHGDIEIHDAGSDVTAQLQSGDARISNVSGNLRVTGRGNEIEVNDVAGDATFEGEFFGPIRVRNVTKTTRYASEKADLTLVHMTGRLELDSGEIDVSDVGGSAKLTTHDKDMDVENVAGRLDIADTHGSIKVSYSQPPRADVNIANESGEVDLTLPSESKFQISAVSSSGEVQSDFDDSTLKLDNENGMGRLSGNVGTQGPKISIATSYGTVYVRKSS